VNTSLTQNWSADIEARDDCLCAYGDKGLMAGALNYPVVLALIAGPPTPILFTLNNVRFPCLFLQPLIE